MSVTVTNIGSNSGTAISTLVVTVPAGGVPAKAHIVVCIADNGSSGAGGSVTDTAGNTYLGAGNNGGNIYNVNSAGATKVTAAVFRERTGLALNQNDTITYTLTTGATAADMSAFYVTGLANVGSDNVSFNNTTATGNSATPSVTSGTPRDFGEFCVGIVGAATVVSTFTQDSTNAAWASPPGQISLAGPVLVGGNVVNVGKTALTYAPTFNITDQWAATIVGYQVERQDMCSQILMMS
jgi:hypothetical protein